MELLLVRHGPAEERGARWPDDRLRPLTADGAAKTARAMAGLAVLGLRPDRILASPLVRARETAELLAAAFDPAPTVEIDPSLVPSGDPLEAVRALARGGVARAALVGHEPSISGTLSALLGGGKVAVASDFKKAAVALVDLPTRGSGILLAFLPPRALRRLGGGDD